MRKLTDRIVENRWGVEFGYIGAEFKKFNRDDFDFSSIPKMIIDPLEKSTQVNNISWLWERAERQDSFRGVFGEKEHTLMLDPPVVFNLFVPEKNQNFSQRDKSFFGDRAEISENITVIYDGQVFIILRPIGKGDILAGGPDFRDCLKLIFSNIENISVNVIGPTPNREKFIFELGPDDHSIEKKRSHVLVKRNPPENYQTFFKSLYFEIRNVTFHYYPAQEIEGKMYKTEIAIKQNIESALDDLNKIHKLRFYQCRRELKLLQNICQNIRDIYTLIHKKSAYQNRYDNSYNDFNNKTEQPLLLSIHEELLDDFKPYNLDLSNIMDSLIFLREEVNSRKNNWIVVITAILVATLAFFSGLVITP